MWPNVGEVHVWRAMRSDHTLLDQVAAGLSEDETGWAQRLCRTSDRNLYVLAHAFMRDILARYLGVAPSDVRFERGPHGKPYLTGNNRQDLCFNLSHSRDAILLALTSKAEVGVDIEYNEPLDDLMDIAGRFFAPDELAALAAHRGENRVSFFYRLWTRKESYLKACGKGLSYPLQASV